MNEKKDSEIIIAVLDALGVNSITSFSKSLGYANGSSLFHIMKNVRGRKINEHLIQKIIKTYPEINEKFLRKKSEQVLLTNNTLNLEQKEKYTLEDMPNIMLQILNELKEIKQLMQK